MAIVGTDTTQCERIQQGLVNMQTVTSITAMSENTVRRLVRAGKFPAPVPLSNRCVRWRANDITIWLQSQEA